MKLDVSVLMQNPAGMSSVGKRRLRKGTFSCWECKRRKRRCDIGAHATTACSWCQQRGLDCVGQDRDDACQVDTTDVEGRLDEVEALVSRFVQQRNGYRRRRFSRNQLEDFSRRAPLTVSAESLLSPTEARNIRCRELGGFLYSALPKLEIINAITHRGRSVFRQHLGMHDDPTALLEGPIFKPHHLLLAARKLFQLALCLRQMQFMEHGDIDLDLGGSPHEIADRYVTAASYVTGQDFLIQSVDGLETLMMQAYCRIYIGDAAGMRPILHCALTNGQRIGLNKAMDACNESRWFRLVYAERFLALGLGKRAFAADCHIASDRLLATSNITRRLERIHVLIAGRIITRNLALQQRESNLSGDSVSSSGQEVYVPASISFAVMKSQDSDRTLSNHEYKETQDLDHQLKQAAKCVPIAWWNAPCLSLTDDDAMMEHISHLLTQLHHHYLLILIHLPYIVDYKGIVQHYSVDYNKQVAMNASREVLNRFAFFKKVTYVPSSFVGMGQKAFAASIALLLLHIASHRLGSQANPFEHQRPQDLCLIEQNIEALESIFASANADSGYGDIATLQKLMEIEAEAAFGMQYLTWVENCNPASASNERGVPEPALNIPIPYHGQICIAKCV